MSSRRPAILMGILLVLLLGYLYRMNFYSPRKGVYPTQLEPLAGKNSVSKLEIKQDKSGLWIADFDYFYTGEPRYVALEIELLPQPDSSAGSF